MNLKSIAEVEDLQGKTIIVRASLNVPLQEGRVRNNFRLKRALLTLKFLQEKGAKVIIISHIGREISESLLPVFNFWKERSLPDLKWGGNILSAEFLTAENSLQNGDILLCENLRQDVREEKNDQEFAEKIARFGNIFVNDAFAEAHREHASTSALAKLLPAYAGLTLIDEVEHLDKTTVPPPPSFLLLGGAKFETKIPLVEKYLALYDKIFIGGALAHDVLKARGFEIGKSLVSEISLADSSFLWNEKIILPLDVVVKDKNGLVKTKKIEEVEEFDVIFDVGPDTVVFIAPFIKAAKTILWNGPFGNYEQGFERGTEAVAKLVAESKGFSVIGGGDTVAAVNKLDLNEKFGFISVGGGSMLAYLEKGTLPALQLLEK